MPTPPDTMVRARFQGGGSLSVEQVDTPRPARGQLLLRVTANALCASDRHQLEHGSAVTPGHEAAGYVAAAGDGTGTLPGTHGVVYLMDYCGQCASCATGATNQCLAKRGDFGFGPDGGYAEYALVSETQFFATPPDITGPEATLLLDVMGTGGHALERAGVVCPASGSLYIAGAGPIGLGVLAMARLLHGPDLPVAISDVIPYRLALAERLGGRPIDARGPVPEALRAAGIGRPEVAVDTTGKAAARRAALSALAQRGVLVCVGHGESLELNVSADLIAPERAVLGSEYFRYDELPANLERLRGNREYLSQVITHRLPLRELRAAYDLFASGDTGKVVVVP